MLRLLAQGQPHWYVGQEALPTGERKTMLFIPVRVREEPTRDVCTLAVKLSSARDQKSWLATVGFCLDVVLPVYSPKCFPSMVPHYGMNFRTFVCNLFCVI